MVINKNNLSIAIHCEASKHSTYPTDRLYVTESGTLALNGPYSVAVSALQKEPGDIVGYLSIEVAESLSVIEATNVSPSLVTPLVANKLPPMNTVVGADKPVIGEIIINANILATIIQSAIDFDGKGVIRLQFTGQGEPVRMDCRNAVTGQRWEAMLMPRVPGLDTERFAEPEMSDFDKAMAEAARLG